MPRVSSAPQDAQKEPPPRELPQTRIVYLGTELVSASRLAMLLPSQIKRTAGNAAARPGPAPEDEQRAIEGLARDLQIAQSVPVIVGPPDANGLHPLIAGSRRLSAAELIGEQTGLPFRLECVIRPPDRDYLFDSVRENIKRRGLTALQFAHLCAEIRKIKNWTGTAEVAAYLGVSRAMVSQHDKLLSRPTGMSEASYAELLALVQNGRAGSDTAFYALTHVEPGKTTEVLERAAELAEAAEAAKPATTKPAKGSPASGKAGKVPKTPAIAPRAGKLQESANKTETAQAKTAPEPAPAKKTAPVRVEKKHVKQAAQELGAVKTSSKTQRTLPELRTLCDKLRGTGYPDTMRNFISLLGDTWWRGDASEKEVVAHWTQIATLVESGQKQERRAMASAPRVSRKSNIPHKSARRK